MAFELLNTFKFLDPVILTGRRKVFTASGTSVFSNSGSFSYEIFNVENASVQPVAKDTQILQADGIREYEEYFVYTSTPLKSSEEATLELADQIQIDGVYGLGWFTVVRVKKHSITSNGSQYEAIVIKNPKV